MTRMALTFELILLLLGEFVPPLFKILPIGGSHLMQVGTLLLMATIIIEIMDVFSQK